ncbi:hypothetical protein HMPREF0281_02331 [Corynebacterium ammoniagenes DSM 20306]|uniref:Uncharacterized protein n=1 Tax=Corynebacterium ammoniagenes DSM 20306 TaxID=649754 RepID=A0ABP2I9T0_CORAM|nr:hypothetical protein HMPREF0281_02331 [Corynebacterium ammoniagenes DSM 20306]
MMLLTVRNLESFRKHRVSEACGVKLDPFWFEFAVVFGGGREAMQSAAGFSQMRRGAAYLLDASSEKFRLRNVGQASIEIQCRRGMCQH